MHEETVDVPTGTHGILRCVDATTAAEPPEAKGEAAEEVVVVRFAKPRSVLLSALVGYLVGKLFGVDGLVGSFASSAAFAFFEALSFFSAKRFKQLRDARRNDVLQQRASVSRWTAVLTSALVNFALVAAVLGVGTLLASLLSVSPSDLGVADGAVSNERFYLTLAAVGFGIGALIIALAFGALLDLTEGNYKRGGLGVVALVVEFVAASASGSYITGPDNVYTAVFSALALWLGCFVWNPLRWARAYYFGADSRALALAHDIARATPKTQYVRRA